MTETRVKELLDGLKDLPVSVQEWDVEIGSDASGDDAVWVWAVLKDADFDRDTTARIRELVRSTLRDDSKSGNAPWVYVRFRTFSEVAAV